ncbi:hypothetical protein WN944_015167 [Citrus x changshan-huyou]|uniref:Uncharacterized protein n=1 Tax=Citrus x changshan-huyou TaxID=2935761 RepID=A0AAP0M6Z5_9ROSI
MYLIHSNLTDHCWMPNQHTMLTIVGEKGPKSSSTLSTKAGRRRERRDSDVGDGLVGDGRGVTTSFVGE